MPSEPPRKIKIIRKALKEIQKLPFTAFELVEKVIRSFSEGNFGDCRQLAGYHNLNRTRKNDIRVIWTKDQEDNLLVIKAGKRDRVYREINENADRDNPICLSDFLNIEEEKIESIPTYEWFNQNHASWYQFVYGGYLYSPVLTKEQTKILHELSKISPYNQTIQEIPSLLVQSAPGTGKTVCAALLACELYEKLGWNIILILPETLCAEVREFDSIKRINKCNNQGFFIGTLEEWHRTVSPELHSQLATFEEELAALEREARRIHAIHNHENLLKQDLLLYRSFVYERDSNSLNIRHPIYVNNLDQIEQLRKVTSRYKEYLNNRLVWLDVLQKTTEELPPSELNQGKVNIFIFDEAQDYLLRELRNIITMLKRWQQQYQCFSMIWLLGDMNQRIHLVDFDWGDLHLNKTYPLKYNYRNTKRILEFANIFHKLAEQANTKSGRHLPPVSNSENAFEEGEKVAILEINSIDQAVDFLRKLSTNINNSTVKNERYLLSKLSQQVCLIYKHQEDIPENCRNLSGLSYLSTEQAKGREFDACIAFSIFQGEGSPSFQEANTWYTIATRPRYRLLVIATSAELDRLGRDKLYNEFVWYMPANDDSSIVWISELSGSEESSRDINAVSKIIYDGIKLDPPLIYWDMYTALSFAKAENSKINEVESKLIERLSKCELKFLQQEFDLAANISEIYNRAAVKSLILRSLHRSWDAVNQAHQFMESMPQEYRRTLNAIAKELEDKQLPYEAARVRMKLDDKFPNEYPFTKLIANNDKPLVSILCSMAIRILEEVV